MTKSSMDSHTDSGINHGFWSDDRGVSVTIDYAIGLLILLTLSGVFIAGVQTISDTREEAVIEQELDRIGTEVASALVQTDTLADEAETRETRTAENEEETIDIETRVQLPSQVNGNSYTVSVREPDNPGDPVTVIVQSQDYTVETTVAVSRTVETTSAASDDLLVTYTDGDLSVEDAS